MRFDKTGLTVALLASSMLPALLGGCPWAGSTDLGEEFLVPFVADGDVEYIDAIVPHHQMATEMAEHVIAAGSSAEVMDMAVQMREGQSSEVALLQSVRQRLTGSSETPPWPADSHMDADMEALMTASGPALDRLFLQHMVEHHSSGISIAHRALPNLTTPELIENANMVISAQSQEIGEIQRILEE